MKCVELLLYFCKKNCISLGLRMLYIKKELVLLSNTTGNIVI